MCGITGFIGYKNRSLLTKLTKNLSLRGPDEDGFFVSDTDLVSFGHRRLSITDLSTGQQPMLDVSRRYVIVYNGEIYNHHELRKELIRDGAIFATHHSDTEVILNGFITWGEKFLDKLNGMFSFAIFDKVNKKVFFARDRFGEKPLYYSFINEKFFFSSEMKSLLDVDLIPDEKDMNALHKFFSYGFIPAPDSPYKFIKKLEPGHSLTFDLITKKIIKKRYWRFSINPSKKLNFNDASVELWDLLNRSVKERIQADVPVGVFLSGGLDSSAVALAAAKNSMEKIKTFSIGFDDNSFDESKYSLEVANFIKSDHYIKKFGFDDLKNLIPKINNILDEPISDVSILPTFLVSQAASEKVKVVLGGDGSDELFAGYAPFKALRYAQFFSNLMPEKLRTSIHNTSTLLPVKHNYFSLDFKIKRFLYGLKHSPSLWNQTWITQIYKEDLSEIFNQKIEYENVFSDSIREWNSSSSDNIFDKSLEFYTNFYLQNILMKVDRSSMINSIEVRSPFLDNKIVDFAQSLPFNYKLRNGRTKMILKKSLKNKLPKKIIYRSKQGFTLPISKWLLNRSLFKMTFGKNFINNRVVNKIYEKHINKHSDERLSLWSLFVSKDILKSDK